MPSFLSPLCHSLLPLSSLLLFSKNVNLVAVIINRLNRKEAEEKRSSREKEEKMDDCLDRDTTIRKEYVKRY